MRPIKLILLGITAGAVCGVVLSLFLICARIVISFARGIYGAERTPLAVVCTLILALLCCFVTAVMQTLHPHCKGSGIPLVEGYARGMYRVHWLKTAATVLVGSLVSFLAGMPLGGEGPSVCAGGLIGDGIGKAFKQSNSNRRHLITGGASAGIAVAFNAPLTGVAFALEETHRRFSPDILLAAFSTVVPAVLVSQLLFWAFGRIEYLAALGVKAGAVTLPFFAQTPYADIKSLLIACAAAAISAVVCSIAAVLFNCCIFKSAKLFSKAKHAVFRLLPAFALTAACGLALAETVGSGEATLETMCENSALWLLFAVLAVRFITTVAASGTGATGGLFLPMIAIGGLIGMIAARLCEMSGADAAYSSDIVMVCIAAFFAASVRAPISAMAMSIELTASFANLLPCAIAVAIATALSGLARSSPLYEKMMEDLQKATNGENARSDMTLVGAVSESDGVCGKRIRDILWPYNTLVIKLVRGGAEIVPDGETELACGDVLTVRAENVDPDDFTAQMREYITTEPNKTTTACIMRE